MRLKNIKIWELVKEMESDDGEPTAKAMLLVNYSEGKHCIKPLVNKDMTLNQMLSVVLQWYDSQLVEKKDGYYLKTEPFAWMRSWLDAYAKNNELDVGKIMDWILRQPMQC
jgi:putative IMPACT (imprinted ancient) family translation regulator